MKRRFLLLVSLLLGVSFLRGAEVRMNGYIDYQPAGSRMLIFIKELQNYSDETTDRLRLRMWASEHHWRANRRGRMIAFSLLPRLFPFEDQHDIDLNRPWRRPPNGWYYVTLTVEERTVDEGGNVKWVFRDIVEFDDRHYFRRDVWPPFPFD